MAKSRRKSVEIAEEVLTDFFEQQQKHGISTVLSKDMTIVHQNPTHHHIYPPREVSTALALLAVLVKVFLLS